LGHKGKRYCSENLKKLFYQEHRRNVLSIHAAFAAIYLHKCIKDIELYHRKLLHCENKSAVGSQY
jgi:hypothetical protein